MKIIKRQTQNALLVVSLVITFSCKEPTNDLSLNEIILIENLSQVGKYKICENNSNSEIISLIKEIKLTQNRDSIYNAIGFNNSFIKKDSVLFKKVKLYFKEENYNHILNQENKHQTWSERVLRELNKNDELVSECNVYISKPIYSKNKNTALVYIKVLNHSSMKLFEMKNEKWVLLGDFGNYIY